MTGFRTTRKYLNNTLKVGKADEFKSFPPTKCPPGMQLHGETFHKNTFNRSTVPRILSGRQIPSLFLSLVRNV